MKYVFLAVVGVFCGLVLNPDVAKGQTLRRQHGSTCMPGSSSNSTQYSESFGLQNLVASAQTFICPYNDDDSMARPGVNTLNVHGYKDNNTGSDQVWACTKAWGTTGFSCNGTAASTTNAGVWSLSPNLTVWINTTANDFSYVKVSLQQYSGIYGIFTSIF